MKIPRVRKDGEKGYYRKWGAWVSLVSLILEGEMAACEFLQKEQTENIEQRLYVSGYRAKQNPTHRQSNLQTQKWNPYKTFIESSNHTSLEC